jgi:hypothetical protein
MRPDQVIELRNNDALRGRLAKFMVRECLCNIKLGTLNTGSDDEMTELTIDDVVNRCDEFLAVTFRSPTIVDALKEYDPVPDWNDPDWYDRITPEDVDELDELIKKIKADTN